MKHTSDKYGLPGKEDLYNMVLNVLATQEKANLTTLIKEAITDFDIPSHLAKLTYNTGQLILNVKITHTLQALRDAGLAESSQDHFWQITDKGLRLCINRLPSNETQSLLHKFDSEIEAEHFLKKHLDVNKLMAGLTYCTRQNGNQVIFLLLMEHPVKVSWLNKYFAQNDCKLIKESALNFDECNIINPDKLVQMLCDKKIVTNTLEKIIYLNTNENIPKRQNGHVEWWMKSDLITLQALYNILKPENNKIVVKQEENEKDDNEITTKPSVTLAFDNLIRQIEDLDDVSVDKKNVFALQDQISYFRKQINSFQKVLKQNSLNLDQKEKEISYYVKSYFHL